MSTPEILPIINKDTIKKEFLKQFLVKWTKYHQTKAPFVTFNEPEIGSVNPVDVHVSTDIALSDKRTGKDTYSPMRAEIVANRWDSRKNHIEIFVRAWIKPGQDEKQAQECLAKFLDFLSKGKAAEDIVALNEEWK